MTRSNWRSGGGSTRAVWVCSRITRFGKEACLESKRIPEEVIFRAFVLSFNNLVDKCKPDIDVFIDKVNKAISNSVDSKEEKRLRGLVDKYEKQIEGLLDLFLENKLTKEDFDKKYNDLKAKHEYVSGCLSNIEKEKSLISEKTTQLEMLKSVLRQEGHLDYFDGKLFKSIVEKVVIGEKDDKGNVDPYKIIFYYKFGMNNKGVELKSEAGMSFVTTSLLPPEEAPRFFYCDDTFVVFIKEKTKRKPYFALRVNDISKFQNGKN
jgi:hypothetical protein